MIPPAIFFIISAAYLFVAGSEPGSVYVPAFSIGLPSAAPLVFSTADVSTLAAIVCLFVSVFGQAGRLPALLYVVVGVMDVVCLVTWKGASTAAFMMLTVSAFAALAIQIVKLERGAAA